MEYVLIYVEHGPAWIITRPIGSTINGTAAYRFPTVFQAVAWKHHQEPRTVHSPDDVSREWSTYCEHHKWSEDPGDPRSWTWKPLPGKELMK